MSMSERTAQEVQNDLKSTVRRVIDIGIRSIGRKVNNSVTTKRENPLLNKKQTVKKAVSKPIKKSARLANTVTKQTMDGANIATSIGADLAGDVAGVATGGTAKLVQKGAKITKKVAKVSVKAAQTAQSVARSIDVPEYSDPPVMSLSMDFDD